MRTDAQIQAEPVAQLVAELIRYHHVADAVLLSESLSDDDLAAVVTGRADVVYGHSPDRSSALARLRTWRKSGSEGLPPHVVAGLRLAAAIQERVGLVLDQVPELAAVWAPEFEDLAGRVCGLAESYGQDGYDTSIGNALGVAQQAARLARRLEARFEEEPAEEPTVVTQPPKQPDPKRQTRPASMASGARWFKMDPRALQSSVESGTIAAKRLSDRRWVFDIDEVSAHNRDADCEPY